MALFVDQDILGTELRSAAPVTGVLARLARKIGRHRLALRHWRDRTAAVRQLTRFDERLLRDIGLSRHELASLIEAWPADAAGTSRD